MAGGALAALAARYWLSKWHWHGVFIPATIVAVAANVASIYATTATEFMVCRALAGLASGSLMAFAYAAWVVLKMLTKSSPWHWGFRQLLARCF